MQLAQGLGNVNNPMMRQLFAQSNPSRYTGVEGSANMVFDMQEFQKKPWKMKGILQNAEKDFGSRRIASANLSHETGVPAETIEKWIQLADSHKLDKEHIDKLEKSSSASKEGGKADQDYDKTGASQLQKYNSALADSAMKASQALDGLRGIIAKAYKAGGVLSPFVSGVASAFGAGAGNLMSIYALDKLRGKGGSGGAGGSGILGRIFKGGKSPVEKEAEKATAKAGEEAVKTGAKSVSHSGIRATASSVLKSSKLRGLVRGAKAGLPGVGDLVFGGLDLATSVATTKKGTKARRKAVGSSLGSSAGSVAGGVVGGLIGSIFPGAGTAVGAVAGSVAGGWLGDKFGGFLGGKIGKSKDKAINKAKGQSLRDARKTASKYNKSGGVLRGILKNGKRFLPGVALGVAGLGLMDDFFGGKAKASSKKDSERSEAWRILRGYDKMLDHAMRVVQSAKSIKNGGDSSSNKDGDDSDISGTSGEGEKAIRSVAKAIGKKLGVDPKLVYAQLMHETGGGTHMAGKNNYGGIVYAGQKGAKAGSHQPDGSGNYADFDSLDDFANAYASTLQKMGINSSIKSVNDWANQLHSKGYFTASPAEYAGGMERFAKQYAVGGIRQYASGSPLITDHPTTNNGSDVYGEAGTEAYVPLNAGHYFSGLSTLDDLAGIFGKKVVSPGVSESGGKSTTINPSYNINLTINGGTDDPDTLAQTVANKVREMLSQYDNQQAMSNQQTFFANETSGLLV